MIKPLQVGYIRVATTAAFFLCVMASTPLFGQNDDLPGDGQRFIADGQLAVRINGSKSQRYVLLDQQGEVMSTLRPAADVDLAQYVGQDVGITARTLIDGETPILLAESVTTFGAARQISSDDIQKHVALASHQNEILVDGNTPANAILTGEEYVDEGYPITTHSGPIITQPDIGQPLVTQEFVDSSCGVTGCASCGGGCGQAACSTCAACPCGLPGRFWIRAEYLIWWTRGMNTPPLVTTSNGSPSRTNAGVLGIPGTEVLYGDEPNLFRFSIGSSISHWQMVRSVQLDWIRNGLFLSFG